MGAETAEPAEDRAPTVWVIRAGRGAIHAPLFLSGGTVAVRYRGVDSADGLRRHDIAAQRRAARPDDSPVAIGLAASALFRFANVLRMGDYVLTPAPGGTLLAGEIVGPYTFLAPAPIEGNGHVRRVRWFARLDRSGLPADMRGTLGPTLTLFRPRFQERFVALLAPLQAAAVPSALLAPMAP